MNIFTLKATSNCSLVHKQFLQQVILNILFGRFLDALVDKNYTITTQYHCTNKLLKCLSVRLFV